MANTMDFVFKNVSKKRKCAPFFSNDFEGGEEKCLKTCPVIASFLGNGIGVLGWAFKAA